MRILNLGYLCIMQESIYMHESKQKDHKNIERTCTRYNNIALSAA